MKEISIASMQAACRVNYASGMISEKDHVSLKRKSAFSGETALGCLARYSCAPLRVPLITTGRQYGERFG
jgi:hypothetical protein